MRVVVALQLCAAVGSLELQRRQALQGLALGVATAAAPPAHAAGAVVSDQCFDEQRALESFLRDPGGYRLWLVTPSLLQKTTVFCR